jgi:hypothetical protein
MGDTLDREDPEPADATHLLAPFRGVARWATGLSNITKLVAAVTALVAAVTGLVVALGIRLGKPAEKSVEPSGSPTLSVTFATPTDKSIVPPVVPTTGVVRGLAPNTTFWIGASASDDPRWHPQDTPCLVGLNGTWDCGDLFIGNPPDAGRRFRIYAIVADDQATAALRLYGQRNKNEPGAYKGLITLPRGAQVSDLPIEVTRR